MRRIGTVLATTHRPALLDACLSRLVDQRLPDGWEHRIYVAGTEEDHGVVVATRHGVNWCTSRGWEVDPITPVNPDWIGPKLKVTIEAALADGCDPILWVGDDDMQPLDRVAETIAQHLAGARMSAVKWYWYLDTATGTITRWDGQHRWYGAGIAARAELWARVRDWTIERAAEPWLYGQLWQHPCYVQPLPETCSTGLVCIQHGRNLTSRQFPAKGESTMVGLFDVTGEGNLVSDVPTGFPDPTWFRSLSARLSG